MKIPMRLKYAVIMAGGSGTCFWPWSREDTPKQLLSIVGQKSMLQHTIDRIVPLFQLITQLWKRQRTLLLWRWILPGMTLDHGLPSNAGIKKTIWEILFWVCIME